MEREETKKVIRKINALFANYFKMDELPFVIDTWHEILEDYEFDEVIKNLKWHIKSSSYPPKISDLVTKQEKRIQHIPNVEETKKFLESNFVENPVTPEEMKEIMKDKLGEKWVKNLEQRKQNK